MTGAAGLCIANRHCMGAVTAVAIFIAGLDSTHSAEESAHEKGTAAVAPPGEGFTSIGSIRPRHAREIESSNWSVGAETMDRDYTVYANWRSRLGPLGVKKARIQSGWAKTEKKKGQYDWAWLDEIIPDMVDQGVTPWVCLCYGNPMYPGGGGTGLGGGFPSSPEALKAWDAFVGALVDRYKKYVHEWEIWNEPRGGKAGVRPYGELVVRTAETIRQRQPKAIIIVAAGGSFDVPFVDSLLRLLRDLDKLHLVNQVAYHPYAYNPDSRYGQVAQLREVVAKYSDRISIRQGENGAPSVRGSFGALSDYQWTEEKQAKWALRRLLGDLGRDIPSSYFSICDMAYRIRARGGDSDWRDNDSELMTRINYKGLLAINEDKTIRRAKEAYCAVQRVTAIFDNKVRRIPDFGGRIEGGASDSTFSLFGYRNDKGENIATLWRDSHRPGERPETERVTIALPGMQFARPVWADLLTGQVYEISDSLKTRKDGAAVFRQMPVYDSVVLIAERSAIPLLPAPKEPPKSE